MTQCGAVLAGSFDQQYDQNRNVGVVDVEHQAGDGGENDPLQRAAMWTCLVPIPKEESDRERGVGVRPRRIEVHVDGKRAGPPYGNRRERGPARIDILTGNASRENYAEKSVERSAESHGDAIGRGKSVS